MYLIFSKPDFTIHNQSYEGFPLLLDKGCNVFVEGVEFLIYHCLKRGSVQSRRSWETFGRDLYDFFAFLEANDLDWRQIQDRTNETLLAVYRDASFEHFNLSASTVNRRLHLAIKFYQFGLKQGWVSTLPYDLETVKVRQPKGFLAHTDTSGGVGAKPDVLLKTPSTKIKVLNAEQIAELLKTIKSPTLHLMVRLALSTGLRKEELLTFPVSRVVKPSSTTARSHIVVELDPQEMSIKGDKARTIHIPVSVMTDLWEYVIHERSQLVRRHGAQPNTLFVTAMGENWSLKSRSLNNQLKALSLPFSTHPHVFRHTYATHTLKSLMQKKSLRFNPLLYVRDRLGHSSITTTERYLHFLDELEDDLRTQYQQEIEDICDELAKV
ncbi:tyrosine-type recombinase/integrase [Marinobacter salarius]|uniref:tyrosine-type recombinase/integrase n=1 Tax=Marinobacter salarius TaxID=1420917 RepID=UPI0025A4398A|nr:tyrosine-type recombinase/integrase [Marinobacter salarius]MDM8181015.1 tyrosine-type recombinase/integrase [Marinobacter salarius]